MSSSSSQPPSSNDGGGAGGGLGHSTPLVSIPSASGIHPAVVPPQQQQQQQQQQSVTDHPLAAPMNVDPQQQRYPTPAATGMATATPLGPPAATANTINNNDRPTTPVALAKPVPKIVSAPVSPSKNLDTLADAFLDGSALRPAPLPQTQTDLERVRVLVERRAWGDVLSMTASLLRGSQSHYTPIYAALLNSPDKQFPSLDSHQQELVELIMLQCHAWIKMRRYSELAQEVSRWSFCFHVEPDDKRRAAPSWIPWSLHILAAASLQYTDVKNKEAATDALWKIRSAILDESSDSEKSLHLLCVEHALTNAFVRKREWRMVLECLDRMTQQLPEAAKLEVEKMDGAKTNDANAAAAAVTLLATAYHCECYSRQGRILLQVGALEEASEIFQKATMLWKRQQDANNSAAPPVPPFIAHHAAVEQVPAQLQANDGLLSFAYNKYDTALESFRNAANIMQQSDSKKLTVDGSYRVEDWIGPGMMMPERKQALYSECMNDMALTALYTCRLHESIAVMESLVRDDPTAFLTERIALNLCTLYELSSDTAVATRKKQLLQLIAKRFFLHDIGPESFRVTGGGS